MPVAEPPDPDTAERDDVAEYCGIKRYRNPDLVPLDQYTSDGFIRCSQTGAEPDPPYTVIANYPVENGERRILSNAAYADYVHEHTALARAQAPVYALLVVGYSHSEVGEALGRAKGTVASHASRIKNNHEEAKQTVDILRDF